MDFERSLLRQDTSETGSFAAYMGISLGCHVILMVFLIVVSGFSGCERRAFSSQVIDVDLVSLGETPGGGGPPEPQLSRPADKQPKEPVPAATEKAVSVPPPEAVSMAEKKPTDKVKKALKEKTFNSQQSVDSAIARLEKKVAQQTSADDASRASSRELDKRQTVSVSGGGGSGGGGSGAGGGRSRQELEAIDIYKLEIRYHILKNWVFSSQLAGTDEGLKTIIGITIAADGRITDTWYDRKSGNEYFDDSAHKAVLKSNPLPRLPEGYNNYTVGLEFTPSDLQ